MDTKEKTAGDQPVRKRRQPPQQGKTARKRPAEAAPASAASKRPVSDARRKRPAQAAGRKPAERAAASRKSGSATTQRPSGSGYKPYRKANSQRRSQRSREIAKALTTFFSYRNPILRFFSKNDMDVFGDGSTREQRKAAQEERRKKRAAQLSTPAIIYTQPKVFNRNRLLVQLLTVVAVVLALVMGMSVFFKVKVITVSGAGVYSPWTIREVSGITEGDNLLTFGRTKASGQIIANLPYVKSARIGIKLPDTVNIEVEEAAVVYSIQDADGVWWLINSDGKVVEQTSAASAKGYTRVLGVTLTTPHPGMQALATESTSLEEMVDAQEPQETLTPEETVPILVTGASRLNAALHILQALEANDIVGSAASVDVSRMDDIVLWYGTQYQVNLGSTDRMEYKIACMRDVILQMSDYQTGILDISFRTWTDQVGYTPFG